jgi:hypothetical protein
VVPDGAVRIARDTSPEGRVIPTDHIKDRSTRTLDPRNEEEAEKADIKCRYGVLL